MTAQRRYYTFWTQDSLATVSLLGRLAWNFISSAKGEWSAVIRTVQGGTAGRLTKNELRLTIVTILQDDTAQPILVLHTIVRL
jgi:hypothetical protein